MYIYTYLLSSYPELASIHDCSLTTSSNTSPLYSRTNNYFSQLLALCSPMLSPHLLIFSPLCAPLLLISIIVIIFGNFKRELTLEWITAPPSSYCKGTSEPPYMTSSSLIRHLKMLLSALSPTIDFSTDHFRRSVDPRHIF